MCSSDLDPQRVQGTEARLTKKPCLVGKTPSAQTSTELYLGMWKRGCFTANVGERLNGIQEVSGSIALFSYPKGGSTHAGSHFVRLFLRR